MEEQNENGTTSPALLALLGDDIMTHTYVTLDQRALSRVVLAITSDEMANTMETPPLDLDVHKLRKRGSTSDNVTNEDLHWPEDTYPNEESGRVRATVRGRKLCAIRWCTLQVFPSIPQTIQLLAPPTGPRARQGDTARKS